MVLRNNLLGADGLIRLSSVPLLLTEQGGGWGSESDRQLFLVQFLVAAESCGSCPALRFRLPELPGRHQIPHCNKARKEQKRLGDPLEGMLRKRNTLRC